MKLYTLPKKDGGVVVLQAMDGIDPIKEIAKWPQHQQDEMTGDASEITPEDYRSIVLARKANEAAKPRPPSLEQRVSALEALSRR